MKEQCFTPYFNIRKKLIFIHINDIQAGDYIHVPPPPELINKPLIDLPESANADMKKYMKSKFFARERYLDLQKWWLVLDVDIDVSKIIVCNYSTIKPSTKEDQYKKLYKGDEHNHCPNDPRIFEREDIPSDVTITVISDKQLRKTQVLSEYENYGSTEKRIIAIRYEWEQGKWIEIPCRQYQDSWYKIEDLRDKVFTYKGIQKR